MAKVLASQTLLRRKLTFLHSDPFDESDFIHQLPTLDLERIASTPSREVPDSLVEPSYNDALNGIDFNSDFSDTNIDPESPRPKPPRISEVSAEEIIPDADDIIEVVDEEANIAEARAVVAENRANIPRANPMLTDESEDEMGEEYMDGLRTPTQERDDHYSDVEDFIDDDEEVDVTYMQTQDDTQAEGVVKVDPDEVEDIRLSQDVAEKYGITYASDDDIEEIDGIDFTTQLNQERELTTDVIEILSDDEAESQQAPFEIPDNSSEFGDSDDEELIRLMSSKITKNGGGAGERPEGCDDFIDEVYSVLREVFHLDGFRPNQLEAVCSTLKGEDVFVLMPTGGGKSLCYQLPALIKSGRTRGTTLVVSPLISLMQDQVQHLLDKNIKAGMISSKGDDADKAATLKLFRDGQMDLVYLSPEMITASGRVRNIIDKLVQSQQLARVVVDEAHCVSSWGHDFRPDYKGMNIFKKNYPQIPIMALTATANEKVRMDIVHHLQMSSPKLLKQSFNRSNLFYEVKWKTAGYLEWIKTYVQNKFHSKSGIIYCHSKQSCELTSEKLSSWGVKAAYYHAGMDPADRLKVQKLWQANKVQLICATIAFGMGIDKPDVRFVIHLFLPRTLEGYYQETGRAGRDGQSSECIMFYSYKDARSLQSFINRDDTLDEVGKESHLAKLRQVIQYCENTTDCRRKQVLQYFNENFDPRLCNQQCDNCAKSTSVRTYDKDVTQHAVAILSMVRQIQQDRVTVLHCQDVYKGSKHSKILRMNHQMNEYHGRGKDLDKTEVERVFFHLLSEGYLTEYQIMNGSFASNYVRLGRHAQQVFSGKRITITFSETTREPKSKGLSASTVGGPSDLNQFRFVSARDLHQENNGDAFDTQTNQVATEEAYKKLNDVRVQASSQLGIRVPSQLIPDETLKEMAIRLPTNKKDFLKLSGIDKAHADHFPHFKKVLGTLSRERKNPPESQRKRRPQSNPRPSNSQIKKRRPSQKKRGPLAAGPRHTGLPL